MTTRSSEKNAIALPRVAQSKTFMDSVNPLRVEGGFVPALLLERTWVNSGALLNPKVSVFSKINIVSFCTETGVGIYFVFVKFCELIWSG